MATIGLQICSFTLQQRSRANRSTQIFLNDTRDLTNSNGRNLSSVNVLDVFKEFCIVHSSFSDDAASKRMFSVEDESVSDFNDATGKGITFVVKTGNYGIESEIVDKNTGEVTHRRTTDEADVKRFSCLIRIPDDLPDKKTVRGIIIFQNIGIYGIKTVVEENLRTFFRDYNLTINIRNVSASAFIEKIMTEGVLAKATVFRHEISPDESDNMFQSTGKIQEVHTRPTFRPAFLDKIMAAFKVAAECREVSEFADESFNDISLTYKIGRRERTLRLSTISGIHIVEDVPESITPEANSRLLIDYMKETAESYSRKMVFHDAEEENDVDMAN